MLNIPVLRWREPYESLDHDDVVHRGGNVIDFGYRLRSFQMPDVDRQRVPEQ